MRSVFILTVCCMLATSPSAAQSLRPAGVLIGAEPVVVSRDALVAELIASLHAGAPQRDPPGWSSVRRTVERRLGLVWRGPSPVLLQVADDGTGFRCETTEHDARAGRCRGRLEGLRERHGTDTTVTTIIMIAASAWLDHDVWEHELTHALLVQHGLVSESSRHDRRYFIARATSWP